jgi:hypothetical protein
MVALAGKGGREGNGVAAAGGIGKGFGRSALI